MHMRIYIDAPDDIRLVRRIIRDTQSRGRDITSVCQQYMTTVRPMHQQFVEPSRVHAHVIIPSVNDITPAVDLLTNHLRQLML
jgi:uridine kinase